MESKLENNPSNKLHHTEENRMERKLLCFLPQQIYFSCLIMADNVNQTGRAE